MTTELSHFIRSLSLEPNLLDSFYADPEATLARSELTEDDRRRVREASSRGRTRGFRSSDLVSAAEPGKASDELFTVASPGGLVPMSMD